MMHGQEKSDPLIRAKKPANKPGQPGAESGEQRRGAEGNMVKPRAGKACSRGWTVYGKQQRQGRRSGSPRCFTT